ncbi:hypothetical protein MUG87_14850 [Ectobacillus sp. JY-23]|uniref:hypothetical protein n=1 Tax=Ectobacillus sp. JY-23 TaxID=2933872 RepID=UPI001FF5B060|nr:hypothetical protein [Ectobacillus sp. JY-23]UOY91761.1 hypothetical protein MUG87_14850 [Ectobacillus sp. JY-23]
MLDAKTLLDLQLYIDLHRQKSISLCSAEPLYSLELMELDLESFVEARRKPTFAQLLFAHIDKKQLQDAQVYKKAGLDRKLFSKIRSNPDYRPRKHTAIALALALELSRNEVDTLLEAAGHVLSESETTDLILLFCLERGIYGIDDVNAALYRFGCKTLN